MFILVIFMQFAVSVKVKMSIKSTDVIDIDGGTVSEHYRGCETEDFTTITTDIRCESPCDIDMKTVPQPQYLKRQKGHNNSRIEIVGEYPDVPSRSEVPISSQDMSDRLKTRSSRSKFLFHRNKFGPNKDSLRSAVTASTISKSDLDGFQLDYVMHQECNSNTKHVEEIDKDLQNLHLEDNRTYWELILKPDSDGDNLLFISIIVNGIDLFLLLVNLIPDCNLLKCANKMFQTALHLAALTENEKAVRRLVVAGAEVDRRDSYGNTALHIACKQGNIHVANSLLTPVTYIEAKTNNYDIPYQKIPQYLEIRNSDGLTCLLIAAYKNDRNMMELLLSKDADINAIDMKSGKTCLHIFAESGNDLMIKFVLSKFGIDVNARTYAGFTAAEIAQYRGHNFVVSQLLYAGTDPNIRPINSQEFLAESDSSDED